VSGTGRWVVALTRMAATTYWIHIALPHDIHKGQTGQWIIAANTVKELALKTIILSAERTYPFWQHRSHLDLGFT
jgi:hypothetical protein